MSTSRLFIVSLLNCVLTLSATTTTTSATTTTTPTTTTDMLTTDTTTPTTTRTTLATIASTSTTNTTTPPTTATTTTTEASITIDPPVVDSWFPTFGPLAGSTKIVLRGTRLNNTIAGIYFEGNNSNNPAVIENSTCYDRLTLLSPSANVSGTVSMIVIALHESAIVANLSFLYKVNPLIQRFDSAQQLLTTGGSILTVIGENLNSVATPQLNVTVVIDQPGTPDNITSFYQNCSFDNATQVTQHMTCVLPNLQLGRDFTRKLQKDQDSGVPTSTTQPGSVAMLFGPNETVAFVYLGLDFDGYRKYDNLSDHNKTGLDPLYLGFIPPPTINSSKDILIFDPNTEDNITIKGKFLRQACDYGVQCQVFIGPAPCTNLSFTYNAITCQPPKDRPHSYPNDTFCTQDHPDTLTIKVVVGFYTYYYRCLEYLYPNIPLIVGLTVGIGTLLLILIIIVVVCFCLRRKRRQTDEDHQNLSNTENQELHDNNPISYNSSSVGLNSDAEIPGFPRNFGGAHPATRFRVGSLANGHDARNNRNRNLSTTNEDYDDTIPGDGSESPRFPDSVQVDDYSSDSRVPYSTDQPGSADLRRENIYPPAFGHLAMLPELAEVRIFSNRNSLFPPL